jgi:CHASE3 domain sensor protein
MGDELTTLVDKIKKVEEKVEKLEHHIDTIRRGDDAAVEALVKKLRFKDGDEALDSLRAEKVALQNEKVELLKEKNLVRQQQQQQQQAGAGTSMLPVRLALVIFLLQRSCCMLANFVAGCVCAYHYLWYM